MQGPPRPGPLAEVVPLGSVPALACSVAAAHLEAVLGFRVDVIEAWPAPEEARIPHRGQHDAGRILVSLAKDLVPGRLRLGITTLDLCLPMLSHVFGEAGVGGRVAVVSLHRLGDPGARGEAAATRRLERLAKVTVHEAGHALGLVHCRRPGCAMGGVPTVESLDALDLRLCRACQGALYTLMSALEQGPGVLGAEERLGDLRPGAQDLGDGDLPEGSGPGAKG